MADKMSTVVVATQSLVHSRTVTVHAEFRDLFSGQCVGHGVRVLLWLLVLYYGLCIILIFPRYTLPDVKCVFA